MTAKLEIYKCEVCGNIVEVLHSGQGTLVCCDQPMKKMEEKSADFKTEKHVPVLEKTGDGKVKAYVGSTLHPMTEEHYIEWIQLIDGEYSCRKFLKPGDAPEAIFDIPFKDGLKAREYCNIHQLWKK